MTEQTTLKMKLTITAGELFALHPLPWSHHLLLIKDANGRQVIHTGGLYDQQGRPYSGPYLSGINALLVEVGNSRVSASPAAPVVDADVINNAANKIADYFNAPPSVIPAIEKIIQRCAAASPASTLEDAQQYREGFDDAARVSRVLNAVATAADLSSQPAIDAAREIAREINGGDRTDGSLPPALTELLEDCSIVNEEKLARWLESIISRYFPEP